MTIGAVATTALSGMQAQNTRLSATARNIANADTIGYSHLSAQFSTGSTGGVQTQIRGRRCTFPSSQLRPQRRDDGYDRCLPVDEGECGGFRDGGGSVGDAGNTA